MCDFKSERDPNSLQLKWGDFVLLSAVGRFTPFHLCVFGCQTRAHPVYSDLEVNPDESWERP